MIFKRLFEKISQNDTAKTLFSNFTYLSLLKCLGLFLPLITYPLVIRTVGAEKYGMVVFAQAIISYITIFINFGFDVSATRKCSESRNDKNKLSILYSSVITLKSLLLVISILVALPVLLLTGYSGAILLLFFMGLSIQEIFFPIWFFQGMEEMKFITIFSFASQCLYVILILLFIRTESDYIFIPIFQSLGGILTSLCSSVIIRKRYKVRLTRVSLIHLKSDFKESVPFFASRFSSVLMDKTNVLVIGRFFSYEMVAIYDLCAKVVSIITMPFSLVAQVLYPNVAKTKNMGLVKKLVNPILGAGVLLSILTIVFSKYIVLFLGGEQMLPSIPIITIMIWYAPAAGIGYLFGASTLVVCGYSNHYNLSVIYSLVVYLALVGVLVILNSVNLYTMALSFLLPQVFVTLYRYSIIKKKQILSI